MLCLSQAKQSRMPECIPDTAHAYHIGPTPEGLACAVCGAVKVCISVGNCVGSTCRDLFFLSFRALTPDQTMLEKRPVSRPVMLTEQLDPAPAWAMRCACSTLSSKMSLESAVPVLANSDTQNKSPRSISMAMRNCLIKRRLTSRGKGPDPLEVTACRCNEVTDERRVQSETSRRD